VARMELGLIDKADAVEHPLNAIVQVPDRSPKPKFLDVVYVSPSSAVS
jgi:hypothetical protein